MAGVTCLVVCSSHRTRPKTEAGKAGTPGQGSPVATTRTQRLGAPFPPEGRCASARAPAGAVRDQGSLKTARERGLRGSGTPARGARSSDGVSRWSFPVCPRRPPATLCQPSRLVSAAENLASLHLGNCCIPICSQAAKNERRDAETRRGLQRKEKGKALPLCVPPRPPQCLCVKACSASVAALPRGTCRRGHRLGARGLRISAWRWRRRKSLAAGRR